MNVNLNPDSPDRFTQLIEPWVSKTFNLDDREWVRLARRKKRAVRYKLHKRQILSALGLTDPVESHRTARKVEEAYERIWSHYDWPQPVARKPKDKKLLVTWQGRGLLARPGATNQAHLDVLMTAIEQLKPSSILEVGFGPGSNLFTLATMFPDISFTGVELTEAGVNTAKSIQLLDQLPAELDCYNPRKAVDLTAHKSIMFEQGDVSALRFDKGRFDLVFTRQVVEQMDSIKHIVLPEMARVSGGHLALIEPFSDYNTTRLQKLASRKKNHFSSSLADLARYNLDLVAAFGDWPQKLDQGIGLALAKRA